MQDLLKRSEVLVTDFSSVYYDYLYMKKPVIFFQWDTEAFGKKHYKGALVDYSDFGDIGKTAEEAVELVKAYFSPGIQKDVKDIFEYHDTNNCERIFKAIERRLEKNGQD